MSITANLPARAGVGFKPEHFRDILAAEQPIGFFEVHAENYMGAGGQPHAYLGALRERYALSIHGVGLSIGAMPPLDPAHLARLKVLCERYEPDSFSVVDDHGSPVADAVWELYAHVVSRTGPIPTLIEWDNNVPDWPTLCAEAIAAESILADAARASTA